MIKEANHSSLPVIFTQMDTFIHTHTHTHSHLWYILENMKMKQIKIYNNIKNILQSRKKITLLKVNIKIYNMRNVIFEMNW